MQAQTRLEGAPVPTVPRPAGDPGLGTKLPRTGLNLERSSLVLSLFPFTANVTSQGSASG